MLTEINNRISVLLKNHTQRLQIYDSSDNCQNDNLYKVLLTKQLGEKIKPALGNFNVR